MAADLRLGARAAVGMWSCMCAEVLYRCAVCLLDPMVVRVPQLIAREALAWMRYVCCAWLVLSCVPPCVGVQGRAAIRARLINVLCAVSA